MNQHEGPVADVGAILAALGIGTHVYDLPSDSIAWDAVTRGYWGIGADEPVSYATFIEGVHPDDRAMVESQVGRALSRDSDGRYNVIYRVQSRDGAEHLIEADGSVAFADGVAVRLSGTVRLARPEAAERLWSDAQLLAARRAAEAEAVYEGAPMGLVLFDRDFRFRRVNQRLAQMNNLAAEAHRRKTIEEVLPPATCAILRAMQPALLRGEAVEGIEVDGPNPVTGEENCMLVSYRPVTDADGAVTGFLGTIVDISERKRSEARERLLMGEVDHRARNLLAVVQSVANLTHGDTVEDYRAAVTQRIAALGRAHMLLAAARWEAVDLARIVGEELAPYAAGDTARVRIDGAALALEPAAAQSMAMVVHELATNAAKYGALSADAGVVTVGWAVEGGLLLFRWEERGGPPAHAPKHKGFGSTVIASSVRQALRGKLAMTWRDEGLLCTIDVPVAALHAALVVEREGDAESEAAMLAPAASLSGCRVLVVEDEPLVAADLEYLLADAGCVVLGPVASVAEGMALLAEVRPDCALIDVNLGRETSAPLADALRAAGVPFAACTGYGRAGLPAALVDAPLLAKPYASGAAIDVVKRLVAG